MALNQKIKKFVTGREVIDLGFGTKVISENQRLINKNGKFNTVRKGVPFLQSFSFYQYLTSISWTKFCLIIFISYIIINLIFATLYYIGGDENFEGIEATSEFEKFLNEFFFSTQTFTTVGYGRINPVGIYSNIISSIESLSGILSFALITGLLYGRFSKPIAKILYSDNAIITPFKDMKAFQFRIANMRTDHNIVDVEVDVMFSTTENDKRRFYNLKLEYRKITFFTATWTVNHPINEESPLYGMTEEDFKKADAEFLILLRGFDDTFAQIVHSRISYRFDEIVWGAKFISIYGKENDGKTNVQLDRINDFEKVQME